MNKKENVLLIFGIIFSIVISIMPLYLSAYTLIPLVILIGFSPYLIFEYLKYKENMEIEKRFPDFIMDVRNNINAGMTLPKAIKSTRKNEYGALTKYVRKMIAQIDWGLPFEKILLSFSKGKGRNLQRMVSTIIETHKGGGNISDIFDYIIKASHNIERLKSERSTQLYSQILSGYVIFFVFLAIMISLQVYLLPSLGTLVQFENEYTELFRWLIIIQGFFSGLVTGKMAEGKMIAGLKHSITLTLSGYLIFSLFA